MNGGSASIETDDTAGALDVAALLGMRTLRRRSASPLVRTPE
jgi:hypothetical protein